MSSLLQEMKHFLKSILAVLFISLPLFGGPPPPPPPPPESIPMTIKVGLVVLAFFIVVVIMLAVHAYRIKHSNQRANEKL